MRALLSAAALAVALATAPPAAAQAGSGTVALTDLTCDTDAEISGRAAWPADDPVWEFDMVRPEATETAATFNGTGLELRNVRYNGRKVFERANVPVLNVEYEPGGGCGCFRDWQDNEVRFQADGVLPGDADCFAESTPGFVQSTCEVAADNEGGDVGAFEGIAFEDYGDELVVTAHMSAGWYRYRMRWHLYTDGRIWPEYSYAAASATCTSAAHRHHAYWRFDFDLDGTPTDDVVREHGPGGETVFTAEADRTWGDAADGVYWSVTDETSDVGYRITPSADDLLVPIDDFSKTDALVLRYQTDEFDDAGGSCAIQYGDMVDGEPLEGEDVVFWYRSSALHTAGNPWECDIVGPTLDPFGYVQVSGDAPAPTAMKPVEVQAARPNPSAGATSVRFRVAQEEAVTVTLYDALGRAVRVLFDGDLRAGRYESVRIEGADLPAGTYVVRVESASGAASTRVAFVK